MCACMHAVALVGVQLCRLCACMPAPVRQSCAPGAITTFTRPLHTPLAHPRPARCRPLPQAESQLSQGVRVGRFGGDKKKGDEGPLAKICRDTSKLSAEQIKGLSSQVVKALLFKDRKSVV